MVCQRCRSALSQLLRGCHVTHYVTCRHDSLIIQAPNEDITDILAC